VYKVNKTAIEKVSTKQKKNDPKYVEAVLKASKASIEEAQNNVEKDLAARAAELLRTRKVS